MDYFNAISLVSDEAAVIERYRYSAFGMRTVMESDWTSRLEVSAYGFAIAFQGQFQDQETGFYDYGYRYDSPDLGRWINRDPIEEDGGKNLYPYLDASPSNSIDAYGLIPITFRPADPTNVVAEWSEEVSVNNRGDATVEPTVNRSCPCDASRTVWSIHCTVGTQATIRLNPRTLAVGKGRNGAPFDGGRTRVIGYEQFYGHEQRHVKSRNELMEEAAEKEISKTEHYFNNERDCLVRAKTYGNNLLKTRLKNSTQEPSAHTSIPNGE